MQDKSKDHFTFFSFLGQIENNFYLELSFSELVAEYKPSCTRINLHGDSFDLHFIKQSLVF